MSRSVASILTTSFLLPMYISSRSLLKSKIRNVKGKIRSCENYFVAMHCNDWVKIEEKIELIKSCKIKEKCDSAKM